MIKMGKLKTKLRQPGVEPGSTAWKATMLTATPLTPADEVQDMSRPRCF